MLAIRFRAGRCVALPCFGTCLRLAANTDVSAIVFFVGFDVSDKIAPSELGEIPAGTETVPAAAAVSSAFEFDKSEHGGPRLGSLRAP